MRLIDTRTLDLVDFSLKEVPKYAILSHTWGEDEISYEEMVLRQPDTSLRVGFQKIQQTCSLAMCESFEYVWIDTCCIDKKSSAELSEAINSMYAWYRRAEKCYVYLSDLAPGAKIPDDISNCRWLTRGWTLQELLAPRHVHFYDSRWNFIGSRHVLANALAQYTKINTLALENDFKPDLFSVATKMSWAARRETTRIEDTAYCLLGLFDINMPLLYGEEGKAFIRLQENIIKATNDASIFAWEDDAGDDESKSYRGLLASRPACFKVVAEDFRVAPLDLVTDFSITNRGVYLSGSINLEIVQVTIPGADVKALYYYLWLGYNGPLEPHCEIGICLRKLGPKLYYREHKIPSLNLEQLAVKHISACKVKQFWIAATEPKRSDRHVWSYLSHNAFRVLEQSCWLLDQVSPTDLWDWGDQLFYGPWAMGRNPLYGTSSALETPLALRFKGSFEGTEVCIIVLCLSCPGLRGYSVDIKLRDSEAITDAMVFSSKYVSEGVDCLQLLDRRPQLLTDWSNSLRFKAGESEYEVSASFVNGFVWHDGERVDVWDLELRTTSTAEESERFLIHRRDDACSTII